VAFLARRLPVAALVTLLLFVTLDAGLGLAHAAPDPNALPATFAFAAPHIGDRALYDVATVTTDDRYAAVPYVIRAVEADWAKAAPARDAEGRLHDVVDLRVRADYHFLRPVVYDSAVYADVLYDAADHGFVGITLHEQFPGVGPGAKVRIGASGQFESPAPGEDANVWFQNELLQGFLGPCGFLPPAAGATVSLGNMTLGGRCGDPSDPSPTFVPSAVEAVGNVPTVRFDGPKSTVWYNPDLPVPVRLVDRLSDLFEPAKTWGHAFDLRLRAFERGDLAVVGGMVGAAAPPMPVAPAPHGVPDETGLKHPFPLSVALQKAGAPLGGTRYLGEAHLVKAVAQDGSVRWEWYLIVTDGHSWQGWIASYAPPANTPIPLPSTPVGGDADPYQVRSWTPDGLPGDVTGIYPTASRVAPTLPRVADAFAAFAGEPGANATPEAWSVAHVCRNACAQVDDRLEVGAWQVPQDAVAQAPLVDATPLASAPTRLDLLGFDAQGRTVHHLRRTETLAAQPLPLLGQDAPGPEGEAPAAPPQGVWQAPGAAVATGVGAAAIVGGLLYWLWPALRSGPSALFSRIQGAAVLENPRRAQVLAAIEADPGIHFQDLRRRLGYGRGALEHHLRRLSDAGLVATEVGAGYTCFFPKATPAAQRQGAGTVRAQGAQRLVAALKEGPATLRTIAKRAGLAPSTASHHLRRMADAGVVVVVDGLYRLARP